METTTKERLKEIMELRDISQADLAKMSGVNKGALSSYLSGRYKPKQTNIYKLAKALNVSEAWLMGHDVPMERKQIVTSPDLTNELLSHFNQLNNLGKKEVIKCAVSEAWLMGHDVPMERKQIVTSPDLTNELLSHFNQLNNLGKKEVIKCAENLTYNPSYKKVTKVDFKKHDEEIHVIAAHNDDRSPEQVELMKKDIENLLNDD